MLAAYITKSMSHCTLVTSLRGVKTCKASATTASTWIVQTYFKIPEGNSSPLRCTFLVAHNNDEPLKTAAPQNRAICPHLDSEIQNWRQRSTSQSRHVNSTRITPTCRYGILWKNVPKQRNVYPRNRIKYFTEAPKFNDIVSTVPIMRHRQSVR